VKAQLTPVKLHRRGAGESAQSDRAILLDPPAQGAPPNGFTSLKDLAERVIAFGERYSSVASHSLDVHTSGTRAAPWRDRRSMSTPHHSPWLLVRPRDFSGQVGALKGSSEVARLYQA
jgi:hypothetical protein